VGATRAREAPAIVLEALVGGIVGDGRTAGCVAQAASNPSGARENGELRAVMRCPEE
jgi:hypothetical protein